MHPDLDPTLGGKFKSVADQILQDLLELQGIGGHGRETWFHVPEHLEAPISIELLDVALGMGDDLAHIEGGDVQGSFLRCHLRQRQHVIDKFEKGFRIMEDLFQSDLLLLSKVTKHAVPDQVRVPNNHVERRAQLVGHRCQKIRLCAVGFHKLDIRLFQLRRFSPRFVKEVRVLNGNTDLVGHRFY